MTDLAARSDRPVEPPIQPPSAARILATSALALMVAAVILVLFVLPAEFGIDPFGTGKKLGLTDLVRAAEKPAISAPASPGAADEAVTLAPVLVPSPTGDAPTVKGAFLAQPGQYHVDARELTLGPNEGLEIKYNLKRGAGLIYSWTASDVVSFEFHGEPDVKPAGKEGTDYYESYELDPVGKQSGSGTFLAPSQGIHGWFWENKSEKTVTVKLVTAGFYDWILQNIKDKQTALKPMDPYQGRMHPAIPDQPIR